MPHKLAIREFQVSFPLLRIRINQNKPKSAVKGSPLEICIQVVGYRLNSLVEPILIAVPKPMQTEFGIHHKLESCAPLISAQHKSDQLLCHAIHCGKQLQKSVLCRKI